MLHKRYGDLGGYGIMSKDLRKRKDEKFVRFAKEYQKKREDSRETWEQQPSNVAYLTTSRIVKRIQLLLPADLKCNNNGEIISLANPCGTWKINSDIQDLALFECDPDRDLDQEERDKGKMSYKNYGMTLVKRKKKRYVYGKRKTIKKMEDLHQSKRHLKIGIRL